MTGGVWHRLYWGVPPERPWSRPRVFAGLVVIHLLAVSVALASTTTFFSPDAMIWGFLLGWIGSFIASVLLVRVFGSGDGVLWLGLAWLVAMSVLLCSAFMVPASVLAARGKEVTATVTADRKESSKGRDRILTLAGPDGRRIPGQVTEHEGYPVGSTIQVVVDPDGLFHPATVQDMTDGDASWWGWLLALPLHAGVIALYWRASRGQRVLPPPATRPNRAARRRRQQPVQPPASSAR